MSYTTTVNMQEVVCCSCNGLFAMTAASFDRYKENHQWWNCPYCDRAQHWSGETRVNKLEKQLQRERAAHDQTRADRNSIKRSRTAVKGELTKEKKKTARTMKGVCPCCNRHFANVARHMKSKHPEEVAK